MKRILFLLSVICFSLDFTFAADCYFVIKEVEVKQRDRNSLVAKQKALSIASRTAFSKLITEELSLDNKVMDSISDKQISDCIYDYSIEQEKHSDLFYIAELSYRFDKSSVSELLKKRGIDCDIVDRKKSKQDIKLVIDIRDHIARAGDLKKIDCVVETFSDKIVVFTIPKDSLSEFRELGIRYAVI